MGHSVPPVSTWFDDICSNLTAANTRIQLKDQSLFKQQAFINGKFVDAKSGQTFDVNGMLAAQKTDHAIARLTLTQPSQTRQPTSQLERCPR